MKRRDFLAATGVAAVGAGLAPLSEAFGSSQPMLKRIGFQLYTARGLMAEDSAKTLEALAGIGYHEVEFAGYHGHDPRDVRRMLDTSGLAAPAAHVPLDGMRSSPESLIEAASVVGHDFLVLAWLEPAERQTLDQYREHAELCNRFGEMCRAAGIQFAYHNHEFEFEPLDGTLPMDLLLSEVDRDLMKIELDLYWIRVAGHDAATFMAADRERTVLCHVKDMQSDGSMTDPGSGVIDFPATFAGSGLTHFFVERDDSPDPMATAAAGFHYLQGLEFNA